MMQEKQLDPHTLFAKAKVIKLVLMDVDGILTDGKIFYGSEGEQLKAFHTRDGFAIKQLMQNNISVGIISGRASPAVDARMAELKVQHVFTGVDDKLVVYTRLLGELELTNAQVAYIGDDTPDLAVLQQVGLSITVSDAPKDIKASVDWCLTSAGGTGAIREVADLILAAKKGR
jgi:3-deoxy-D-manno-octulosonate 8-phosphate phosphatase (KDO 8-P phosphatase)